MSTTEQLSTNSGSETITNDTSATRGLNSSDNDDDDDFVIVIVFAVVLLLMLLVIGTIIFRYGIAPLFDYKMTCIVRRPRENPPNIVFDMTKATIMFATDASQIVFSVDGKAPVLNKNGQIVENSPNGQLTTAVVSGYKDSQRLIVQAYTKSKRTWKSPIATLVVHPATPYAPRVAFKQKFSPSLDTELGDDGSVICNGTLLFSCEYKKADIYFTTDGRIPDPNTAYTHKFLGSGVEIQHSSSGPLVVRAVAVVAGYSPSRIKTIVFSQLPRYTQSLTRRVNL
eukprot:m.804 g.804  ORF g.804 m.804 type:complete len:283 (+) comp470_c0_seq2:371-1219(+)